MTAVVLIIVDPKMSVFNCIWVGMKMNRELH